MSPGTPHDLSPLGLFLMADWVVRSVMLLLLVASVLVWVIALDRGLRLSRLRAEARALNAHARGGRAPGNALARSMLDSAEAARLATAAEPPAERRARMADAMRLALADHLRPAQAGLGLLASIAAVAPFIGLFGTVWGIMNSFAAIAQSGQTSLAAVAPGIAEALFATAIGLVAAIPALLAYNRLAAIAADARAEAQAAILRLSARAPAPDAGSAARLAAE